MIKLRKKILLTAGLIGITTPIMAETSYQCLSCPSGTYSVAGSTDATSCKLMGTLSSSIYTKTVSASQGEACSTGTILAGQPYRVVLRGGKGGKTNYQEGANGGFVEYEFLPNVNYSYELCAGGDGGTGLKTTPGGGGAGSWLKLTYNNIDFYIVAGGGGGGYGRQNNTYFAGSGGGGIGSGGGRSGGLSRYSSEGSGLVKGTVSAEKVCVGDDSWDDDEYILIYDVQRGGGGMYGPIVKNMSDYCENPDETHDIGYTISVKLYGNTLNNDIALGGSGGFFVSSNDNVNFKNFPPLEGKTSHKTNVSTLSGKCSGTSGCAVLLSL